LGHEYSVQIDYTGDGVITKSSTAPTNLDVSIPKASVTMGTIQTNPNSPHCGQPFTASVTLSSPCSTPTGSVTFTFDNGQGNVSTYQGAIDGNGVATVNVSNGLPADQYTVTADYQGDESSGKVNVNNGLGVGKADCFIDFWLRY